MDLTAAAVAEWHALMPPELRSVVRNDASPHHDVVALALVEDLSTVEPDLVAHVLVRHIRTIAAFGQARRIRMLADLATMHTQLPPLIAGLLANPEATPAAELIRADIEILARIVKSRITRTIEASHKVSGNG